MNRRRHVIHESIVGEHICLPLSAVILLPYTYNLQPTTSQGRIYIFFKVIFRRVTIEIEVIEKISEKRFTARLTNIII